MTPNSCGSNRAGGVTRNPSPAASRRERKSHARESDSLADPIMAFCAGNQPPINVPSALPGQSSTKTSRRNNPEAHNHARFPVAFQFIVVMDGRHRSTIERKYAGNWRDSYFPVARACLPKASGNEDSQHNRRAIKPVSQVLRRYPADDDKKIEDSRM